MVGRGVNMVDSYSVRPKICQHVRVKRALFLVYERVLVGELVGNAYMYISDWSQLVSRRSTFDVVLSAIGEEEFGADG